MLFFIMEETMCWISFVAEHAHHWEIVLYFIESIVDMKLVLAANDFCIHVCFLFLQSQKDQNQPKSPLCKTFAEPKIAKSELLCDL